MPNGNGGAALDMTPEKVDELIKCLAEELAESAHIAMKASRHGLGSSHADYGGLTNRVLLSRGLGHVRALEQALLAINALSGADISKGREHKLERLGRFLHRWSPIEWATLAGFVQRNAR